MKCPDCGSKWGEMDMLLQACTGCGDALFPEDVDKLRKSLGISGPEPPVVEQPVIESEPEDIPDSAECPECLTPLIGDDLHAWVVGGTCNYCPATNPGVEEPDADDIIPTDIAPHKETENPAGRPPAHLVNTPVVSFFINNGPMVGETIDLKTGILGRGDLSSKLSDPWYEPHVGRISREHIGLTCHKHTGSFDVNVKDLGSTNGTWLRGERLVSTSGTPLEIGEDLNLGGNIQLSLIPDLPGRIATIQHIESKVKFAFYHDTEVHLGRQSESGQRERWAQMADLQLRSMGGDPEILSYLSRRHFTLKVDSNTGEINTEVFEGKEEPEIIHNGDGTVQIRTRKNGFILNCGFMTTG